MHNPRRLSRSKTKVTKTKQVSRQNKEFSVRLEKIKVQTKDTKKQSLTEITKLKLHVIQIVTHVITRYSEKAAALSTSVLSP